MTRAATISRTARAVALLLLCTCGSSDCPFEVDDVLAHVGVAAPGRSNCGSFNVLETDNIQAAISCLFGDDGVRATNTELTVTRCADCLIQSTYIATTKGDLYHVSREDDAYGDDKRTVSVERCSDIAADNADAVSCVAPSRLFACEAKR